MPEEQGVQEGEIHEEEMHEEQWQEEEMQDEKMQDEEEEVEEVEAEECPEPVVRGRRKPTSKADRVACGGRRKAYGCERCGSDFATYEAAVAHEAECRGDAAEEEGANAEDEDERLEDTPWRRRRREAQAAASAKLYATSDGTMMTVEEFVSSWKLRPDSLQLLDSLDEAQRRSVIAGWTPRNPDGGDLTGKFIVYVTRGGGSASWNALSFNPSKGSSWKEEEEDVRGRGSSWKDVREDTSARSDRAPWRQSSDDRLSRVKARLASRAATRGER